MNLASNAWHVRWFHFVQRFIGDGYKYRRGTNLCHFMRVTLIWGPLATLFFCGATGFILFAFFIGPVMSFGWLGALAMWAGIIAFFFGLYGLTVLVGWLRRRPRNPHSFASLTFQHVKAVKGRFCPMLTFAEQEVEG